MKSLLSTPDRITEQLRNQILSGRFAPGEALRQDEIARSFGVSHVPIREVFLRLEAERLVEIRPRRGAIVAPLSAAELEELLEMRVALECCALRTALPKFTEDDARKATQILERIDRQPERWGELNTAFHTVLYRPADRPRLAGEILALQRNVERYLHQEAKVTNNLKASQREHRTLLGLIERRNIDAACALLTKHILEPGRILVSKLRES